MKRSSVVISAAAGMIIGGITLGGVATAASGPTISGTVVANQGTGTGIGGAWKVDGSAVTQPVAGTVSATESGPWAVTVTPGTPYTSDCENPEPSCSVTPPANPVLVKDVSLDVAVPTGSDLDYCQAFIQDPANASNNAQSFIPMIKQGTYGGLDGYVGNSQVTIAVPAGATLGVFCTGATIDTVSASFQGDVTS